MAAFHPVQWAGTTSEGVNSESASTVGAMIGSAEMKPTDHRRNRMLSGQPARVPDGVDDPA